MLAFKFFCGKDSDRTIYVKKIWQCFKFDKKMCCIVTLSMFAKQSELSTRFFSYCKY